MLDCDRERAAVDFEDWGVVQERGDGTGRHRGRHDHDDQVVPDRLADFPQQGQRQVAVEAALVELIQDDRSHTFQEGVVEQPAGQDSLGQDLEPGARTAPALESHLIADLFPEGPAAFLGDARRGGPRRHAPGLQDQDIRVLRREQPG